MNVFFLAVAVLCSVSLTADIILMSVLKINNFGNDKSWVKFHGRTIPTEEFIPDNITPLLIFGLIFSISGAIYGCLGIPLALSIIFGILTGLMSNFLIKHWIMPLYRRIKGDYLPKDKPDAGARAICRESILGGGYGSVEVEYKGKTYVLPALSANETDIEAGEEVTVVTREEGDGVCWVEKKSEELTSGR